MAESIIKQTNRTLLIEEINPEKLNLLTLVGDVRGLDSLSDDKIKEINEALLVRNFEEFLEKFDPTVYSFFNAATGKIVYSKEKPAGVPENMLSIVHLNAHNDFLKMLMTLVETKRSQGIINADFKFEKLTEMISPSKVMDDIKQVRKELQYTYTEYAKLEDGDPHKLDLGDKLNSMFEEASANYQNLMAMIPLAISDIKTRLLLGESKESESNDALTLGLLTMSSEGELTVIEAPKVEEDVLMIADDNANAGLIEALEEDYDALNSEGNSYVKQLVVRTFCPLNSSMQSQIDVKKEVANYNTYLEFYKNAKDDFIKVVKPLVEKILGVWAFFEQYPKQIKGMRPSLLIANVKNEVMANSLNVPKLCAYLNTVNEKNDYSNTVWYGIVAGVSLDEKSKMNVTRERFKGNKDSIKTENVSVESLARIADALKDYGVQCFYSYETGDKTTFNSMSMTGVGFFDDRCASLSGKPYSEYLIPCVPNFTIIPKDKSGVKLESRMIVNENEAAELSKAKEDIMKLWIDGVYIGAAYVAAGFVASYQSPEYLKEYFKKDVDTELPGVRFDIEAKNNSLKIHTTMSKEITGFTNSVKDDINKRGFGFVFSSENAVLDGENISHIMVYKARNLKLSGGSYEPIYKTQTANYIERILRHATGDFKQENIAKFFSNNPSSQKSIWLSKKNNINGILGSSDDITYEADETAGVCAIEISFGNAVKRVEVPLNRVAGE